MLKKIILGILMMGGLSIQAQEMWDETVHDSILSIPSSPFDLSLKEPKYSKTEEAAILKKYKSVDPGHEIPTDLLKKIVLFYEFNLAKIVNKKVMSVVDFGSYSGEGRFYIIDM